jgi:hypothetical protein
MTTSYDGAVETAQRTAEGGPVDRLSGAPRRVGRSQGRRSGRARGANPARRSDRCPRCARAMGFRRRRWPGGRYGDRSSLRIRWWRRCCGGCPRLPRDRSGPGDLPGDSGMVSKPGVHRCRRRDRSDRASRAGTAHRAIASRAPACLERIRRGRDRARTRHREIRPSSGRRQHLHRNQLAAGAGEGAAARCAARSSRPTTRLKHRPRRLRRCVSSGIPFAGAPARGRSDSVHARRQTSARSCHSRPGS